MKVHHVGRLLVVVTALGLLGTLGELALLEHTEGRAQKVPLIVATLAAAVSLWFATRPSRRSRAAFRGAMLALVVTAFVSIYFHFTGNLEFEREMRPGSSGATLVRETLMGATPTLAPGMLAQIGLIGLIASALLPRVEPNPPPDEEPSR